MTDSRLADLLEVARDRRYSDEFVGMVLRARLAELERLLSATPITGE